MTIWCFAFASLALIGIPPASGFMSKWYLAQGALASGTGAFTWFGPVVLLASALLTAGYLLPVVIHGFFPGADYNYSALKKQEPSLLMTIPMALMAAGALIFGMFPDVILNAVTAVAGGIF